MKHHQTVAALAALLGLAACASVDAPALAPFQTSSGGLGFTVSGLAQFTRDEAMVEQTVRASLEGACPAGIEDFKITFQDATSRGGVPHLAYTAQADCKR